MRLFDTLSRHVKELKPSDGRKLRFYCCGPTVYGPAHIGNFRTFVLQDVFRRVLETSGVATFHVRNITDVDDKTIRDSQRAGMSLADFTQQWTEKFHRDCDLLNCLPPHEEPRAAAHILEQVDMIARLVDRGHAYASEDGSVYFNIASFPEYGRLSRLDQRELELGKTQATRADADEYEKQSVSDFVLWKARREDDGVNFWPSPWGEGRPGWHLECSAMIEKYLGADFDVHGGGVDLVFPHHENELAQSRCACGGHFASHWFHVTHLLVDGGKMSKSLGNMFTLSDLQDLGWTPMELRYVLISGYYRKPLNFTMDSLHAAREAMLKLAKGAAQLARNAAEAAKTERLQVVDFSVFASAWQSLIEDMNTPAALGGLFTGMREAVSLQGVEAMQALAALQRMLRALGLVLPELPQAQQAPADVQALAEQRWAARAAKQWAESDRLRDELAKQGWLVKDGKEGYELVPAE